MIPGVTYPANGVRFYKEDHDFEQLQKSNEIINSRKDSFSGQIVEGGNVIVGTGTTISITTKTIAYDEDSNRIEVPIITNFIVPDNANSKIVIRYKETIQAQAKPDGNSIDYRYPDYEVIARTGSLLPGDVPLRQISVTNGVVTIQEDLRNWRKVKDVNILNKSNLGESFKGFQMGILQVGSSNTILRLPRGNIYEVKNKYIQIPSSIDLDFSALVNIFRVDGTTQIAASSEIQNKHMYLLLSDTGVLSAMIIPNADLPGSSHSYAVNPSLCKDFYSGSPTIWNPDENGFYKGNKRIIATLRIGSSNQIEFFYELGFGNRFLDVQNISIGNIFTETRWKREHPSCYVPDGSTVTNMATEAPVLHRILGGNILPDWRDRFGRNIDLNGARAIRDLQEDAFQGHRMSPLSPQTQFYGVGGEQNFSSPTGGGGPWASMYSTGGPISDGTNGTPRIANETRGKNYARSEQIVRG
jgi:hypothetical protein